MEFLVKRWMEVELVVFLQKRADRFLSFVQVGNFFGQ